MNGKPLMIAAGILAVMTVTALVTYLLTKNDLENRRSMTVSPTIESSATTSIYESRAATSTSEAAAPQTESDIIKDALLVRSVAQRYTTAIAAGDEPAAAQFTCHKTDGGLLWISANGRPVSVLRVVGITTEPEEEALARVMIQVADEPPAPLILKKAGGTWCVRR